MNRAKVHSRKPLHQLVTESLYTAACLFLSREAHQKSEISRVEREREIGKKKETKPKRERPVHSAKAKTRSKALDWANRPTTLGEVNERGSCSLKGVK